MPLVLRLKTSNLKEGNMYWTCHTLGIALNVLKFFEHPPSMTVAEEQATKQAHHPISSHHLAIWGVQKLPPLF